jgi:outer membrane protein insertion porin family
MQKKIIVFLTAIFLFSGMRFSSFAQKERVSSTQQAPQKLVTAIEVKGNKAISTNVIISKMKTRIGSPYMDTVVSDDLKRLYLLGFFSDINIDHEDYKNGVKVVVTVAERPIISKITFSGLYRLTMKDEKIKEKLKSKEGQYLDYPSLGDDIGIIHKLYEKIGFSQALIEYKVDVDPATNKAAVDFSVNEGKKVRIKSINIKGNKAFTAAHIRKLLKTKSAWFFNAGVIKEDVLKEDMERIKAFYQRNGYSDIAVSYEVIPDPRKRFLLNVNITVEEGKKYLVGNVTISGNKDIPEKAILLSLKEGLPGKVYSQEAVQADVVNIQAVYFDRGYISVQIEDATSVNTESGRVDITYNITENKVAFVNKIKVRGNIKTKDIVVRREMRLMPGDKFDGEKLRRSKERLTNLGFFEDVSYDTEEAGAQDKRNLIVEVKESKTGAFSFGGGYSTVDSLVGFVEIEQKNFDWQNWPYFTGAGQDLKFRASFGNISSAFDISFTEPWMFDRPVSFGFDLYKREHKRDTDVGYGYDENVLGGDLRLGKELREYLRGDLVYRLDQIKISNVSSDASASLTNEVGTNVVSSLTPIITFDNRDNVFDTHKGNYLNGSLEWAGGPLGADKNYWKFFGQASHFTPMPRNATIEFRGRLGLAEPYGNSNDIPIYERFFSGGAYTIRGYEERVLGPVDPNTMDPLGGNATLIGNIEYTYPLFNFLKLAAFYDVGNTWDKIGDLGSNKDANGVSSTGGFKSGIGLGVRLKTPLGPISLDYGIPMDKAPGQENRTKTGRFHFAASNNF